jgi:WD40 repeat protein
VPDEHAIFSPDARTVYSCGDDEYLRVWNVESGRETAKFDLKCRVMDLALADEGELLLAVTGPFHPKQSPARLWAWDLRTGKEAAAFPAVPAGEQFNAIAISPDGKRAATVAIGGVIRIWDVPGRKLERTWTVPEESDGYGIAWSPDERHISVAGVWFSVWEAASGKSVYRSSARTWIDTTAFSPDGKQVFAAGKSGVVQVYTRTTWQLDRELQTHESRGPSATYLSVTPNGRLLLLGAHTADVRLWDVAADRALARLVGKDLNSIGVAASADGKWAVAGSEDGKVRVWRLPEVPAAKH